MTSGDAGSLQQRPVILFQALTSKRWFRVGQFKSVAEWAFALVYFDF
jgi:hypothetical protein